MLKFKGKAKELRKELDALLSLYGKRATIKEILTLVEACKNARL